MGRRKRQGAGLRNRPSRLQPARCGTTHGVRTEQEGRPRARGRKSILAATAWGPEYRKPGEPGMAKRKGAHSRGLRSHRQMPTLPSGQLRAGLGAFPFEFAAALQSAATAQRSERTIQTLQSVGMGGRRRRCRHSEEQWHGHDHRLPTARGGRQRPTSRHHRARLTGFRVRGVCERNAFGGCVRGFRRGETNG